MSLSIIIPTLNEARLIEHTLQGLKERAGDVEIGVVDGESTDETAALAGKYVRVIRAKRGRGGQLNAGVQPTGGDILLFLHADTLPDAGGTLELLAAKQEQRICRGAFGHPVHDP